MFAMYAAHDLCAALDDGTDAADLATVLAHSSDLTTDRVATFVVASIDSYCPEYSAYFD
jgi:hypothetical protein